MKSNDDDVFEKFQYWLVEMDSALESFFKFLPTEMRTELDYTPASVDTLERWLLRKYETIDSLKLDTEKVIWDGASRYIGETFRKCLGGKWHIDKPNKKIMFSGLPQLVEMRGQVGPVCPLTLVSAALDRRVGNFISSLIRRHLS